MTPGAPATTASLCATHPDRRAVGACKRCGRFTCAACVNVDFLCVDCVQRGIASLPPTAPRAKWATRALLLRAGFEGLYVLTAAATLALPRWEILPPEGGEPGLSAIELVESLAALPYFALVVVNVVLFLRWYHLAATHLTARGVGLGATPGTAVVYWFIPFVNLARPYAVTRAMAAGVGRDAPLAAWWALWILGSIVGNLEGRLALRGEASELMPFLGLASSALMIGAAVACVRVVRAIDDGLSAATAADPGQPRLVSP